MIFLAIINNQMHNGACACVCDVRTQAHSCFCPSTHFGASNLMCVAFHFIHNTQHSTHFVQCFGGVYSNIGISSDFVMAQLVPWCHRYLCASFVVYEEELHISHIEWIGCHCSRSIWMICEHKILNHWGCANPFRQISWNIHSHSIQDVKVCVSCAPFLLDSFIGLCLSMHCNVE